MTGTWQSWDKLKSSSAEAWQSSHFLWQTTDLAVFGGKHQVEPLNPWGVQPGQQQQQQEQTSAKLQQQGGSKRPLACQTSCILLHTATV